MYFPFPVTYDIKLHTVANFKVIFPGRWFLYTQNGLIKMFKIVTSTYNPGLPGEMYHSTR
jgi:hypothetical protein